MKGRRILPSRPGPAKPGISSATKLDEVAGCLRSRGKAKTLSQMEAAIKREVTRRHYSGRY